MRSRRILVTGCASGIGRDLAEVLLAAGHRVLATDRTLPPLEQAARAWPAAPERLQLRALDVTDPLAWEAAVAAARQRFGGLDVLVNVAGVLVPGWAHELRDEAVDLQLDVNVKGVANTLRHFVPAMIERGRGVIVNLSSGWGRSVDAEVAPYCTTKWAIEGLSRALALELPPGLACVPLSPGVVDTDMLRRCWSDNASSAPKPDAWARAAARELLTLGEKDNGKPRTITGT